MFDRAKKKVIANKDLNRNQMASPLIPSMVLTVEQLSKEFQISVPNAYLLVKRDGFPSFSLGKRILISRIGLQKWIDQQCATKTTNND